MKFSKEYFENVPLYSLNTLIEKVFILLNSRRKEDQALNLNYPSPLFVDNLNFILFLRGLQVYVHARIVQ